MQGTVIKLRKGQGPLWGGLKRAARWALSCHLPVTSLTRPLFAILFGVHVVIREVCAWIVRFCWSEPLFRSQCASVGDGFRMERLPYLLGRGEITLGRDVRLSGKSNIGFGSVLGRRPTLSVGDGTFIGHNCSFSIAASITIGRNCLLAGGVSVRDHDGHPLDAQQRREGRLAPPESIRAVVIGNDVWIGADAIILKGVTIGDRAVVGAAAVVTGDVPPDSVVAGNPARLVKVIRRGVAA